MSRLFLPDELRQFLKEPFGELIVGSNENIILRLKEIIASKKPRRVISIGDNVSRLISENHMNVDIKIIDNQEMRKLVKPFQFKSTHIFKVLNHPGGIEDAVWPVFNDALKKDNSLIIVEGEEDLLTLVAVNQTPLGSLILYGQPKKGVVAVIVTNEIKTKVDSILKTMRRNTC